MNATFDSKTWDIIDYVQAGMLARNKDWRAGQALFNAVDLICPEIANKLRGGAYDPFHNNSNIREFLALVKKELDGGTPP